MQQFFGGISVLVFAAWGFSGVAVGKAERDRQVRLGQRPGLFPRVVLESYILGPFGAYRYFRRSRRAEGMAVNERR
ncbi:MAG: hypothetical protein AB7N24_02115 [Dehalococcoidia bacterium]